MLGFSRKCGIAAWIVAAFLAVLGVFVVAFGVYGIVRSMVAPFYFAYLAIRHCPAMVMCGLRNSAFVAYSGLPVYTAWKADHQNDACIVFLELMAAMYYARHYAADLCDSVVEPMEREWDRVQPCLRCRLLGRSMLRRMRSVAWEFCRFWG